MNRLEKQAAEPSSLRKSNTSGKRKHSKLAGRPGLTPSRSEADRHLTSIKRRHSQGMTARPASDAPPQVDLEEVGPTVVIDPLQMSLSGVVNAILEVGRQRKALLDQLRAALLSGNVPEALGFARHLCGLAA